MIMDANIGSTFAAQIIAFNVSALRPFMPAFGFLGYAFTRCGDAPSGRQHTYPFSVVSALVLIWFTAPMARLAELIVPERRGKAVTAGDPQYLDEASLAAPSLGLQKARLETAPLGKLVLQGFRRGSVVAIEGK